LDASAIAAKLSGTRIPLDEVSSPQAFVSSLPLTGMPASTMTREEPAAAAEHGTFDLHCTLDLTDEDGTVFVNKLDYELVPKPGFDANQVTQSSLDQKPGLIVPRSWSRSPD